MIDTLPSRRSAIFTDTAVRKLPRSFYWGAGVALLVHAGLIYYLVQQNFSHLVVEGPGDPSKPVTISMDPPPQPPPVNTQHEPQRTASQVKIHITDLPLDTKTDTTPLASSDSSASTSGPLTTTETQTASASSSSGEAAQVTPRWKAFPDAATLADYYPARAIDNEMEGSASVQCTVLDTAGRVHCVLVSETPKGYGFGQRTVKMVEEKGRVDTSVGNIKVGSVLAVTTVKWQLN